jgi:hypothetical protein
MTGITAVRAVGDMGMLMLGIVLLFSPDQSRAIAGLMIIVSIMRLLVAWIEERKPKSTPE